MEFQYEDLMEHAIMARLMRLDIESWEQLVRSW